MDYGKVAGIDKPVSRIVFGTDRLRGRRLPWLPNRSLEQQAFSLLDRSFELGCNAFDTARIYWDSERTLGAWIRERRNRDKVVVISKGCHPHLLSRRPRLSALMYRTTCTHPSRRSAQISSICICFTTTTPGPSRTDHGTAQPPHRRRQDRRDRCVELVSRANCQRQHVCRRQGPKTLARRAFNSALPSGRDLRGLALSRSEGTASVPHENGIRRTGCRCSRGPASPADFSPTTTIRRIRAATA